jgi:hypothetical protein
MGCMFLNVKAVKSLMPAKHVHQDSAWVWYMVCAQ